MNLSQVLSRRASLTGFELAPLSHVLLPKLRYHHKLVLSILIVMGIVALLLIASQDLQTLQIESQHGAEDPLFPSYIAALLGAQATGGNRYDVLSNGDQIFPSMLAAIQNARRRVSFETYIYEKGVVGAEFTDALEAAAKRHVKVDLVVDALGSKWIPKEWTQRLEDAGVVIGIFGTPKWYAPKALNNRTHRKILIVDGRIGFTGGVGLADHWLGHAEDKLHWRDMMVRVEGPAARLMEGAFDENLIETHKPVTPIVDPPPDIPPTPRDSAMVLRSSPTGGSSDLKRLYLLSIAAARRTLDICSPYFILDESSNWALSHAVKRGVRVRILVEGDMTDAKPVKYSSRDAYEHLLQSGISIYEYQPTMMHTKAMVVDGVWSVFGSANFDNRSLETNDEMNVVVSDTDLAARLRAEFEHDLQSAKKLELDEWRGRSPLEKARERFWSYFGELF
jgi:cardiolipin synthase